MADSILITGAKRGIGLEMTRRAAAAGHYMTTACCTPDLADELNSLAANSGDKISFISVKVRDEESIRVVAAKVRNLDLIVCNAGTLKTRGGLNYDSHTTENVAEPLITIAASIFLTIRHFTSNLKNNSAPRIAVISSQVGSSTHAGTTAIRVNGGSPIYRATEAAATNLARSIALELAAEGIAVGAYHPGWV